MNGDYIRNHEIETLYRHYFKGTCKFSLPYYDYIYNNITSEHVKLSLISYIRFYHLYFKLVEFNSYQVDKAFRYDDEVAFYNETNSVVCQIIKKNDYAILDFIIDKFMSKNYQEFREKTIQFVDKHSHGLNATKELIDFFGLHYSCETDKPSIDCRQLSPTSSLLSPYGKCHTFLWNNDFNQTHVKDVNIYLNVFLNKNGHHMFWYPHYLSNRVLLHDKSTIPSDESIEITPMTATMFRTSDSMAIELKKVVIKRLEKPYDTQCHDYGDSNRIDCLNRCYMKIYHDHIKCLPNHNTHHTMILNFPYSNDERKLFCSNNLDNNNITQLEKQFQLNCQHLCGTPCIETVYHATLEKKDLSETKIRLTLYFKENTYTSIQYVPKLTIMEFLINLFNIWNFWHGTSFVQVFNFLTMLTKKFLRLFANPYDCFNPRVLIKIISKILSLLFATKLIFLTMDYFNFETITKINLVDYSDDFNYPIVSFIFTEKLLYFPMDLLEFKDNVPPLKSKYFNHYHQFKSPSSFMDIEEFLTYSQGGYSTIELAEYILGIFNVSTNDLLNKSLAGNYYLPGTYYFENEIKYKMINLNYTLSYSTDFRM